MSRTAPQRVAAALGVRFPLMLAGMGGVAGPELVAAVSEAGAAGTLGLYRMPAERIADAIGRTQALTAAPFGANFVPEVLDEGQLLPRVNAAIAASRSNVFLSFFGLPPPTAADAVHTAGRRLVIQVGTAADAMTAAALGAHVVVLQGVEAGGHLLGKQGVAQLLRDTRARLPSAALAVAGGIASGADFARLAEHGADGVCCGTLFIPAHESRAHPLYKQAVLQANAADTEITGLFETGWPGRPHRVVSTAQVARGRGDPETFIASTAIYGSRCLIPRYSAAVPTTETVGAVMEMALYCGTSCGGIQAADLPARALVSGFVESFRHAPAGAQAHKEELPWTSTSHA
ncbi:MAG: nitronate monooxygenase [Ramlibacter sp.]|nr:nitronate monooxygenase [Ramlibacter sp.]